MRILVRTQWELVREYGLGYISEVKHFIKHRLERSMERKVYVFCSSLSQLTNPPGQYRRFKSMQSHLYKSSACQVITRS